MIDSARTGSRAAVQADLKTAKSTVGKSSAKVTSRVALLLEMDGVAERVLAAPVVVRVVNSLQDWHNARQTKLRTGASIQSV